MTDHPKAGDPSYNGFRINTLWAWTQIDPEDDQEGILSIITPTGHMPLIASDRVRLEDYRKYATMVAVELGRTVQLRRFSTNHLVEEILPDGTVRTY